jgi:hypothetical protein
MSRLVLPANWSIVGVEQQTLKFMFRNDLVRVENPASSRVWPKCAWDDRVRGEFRQYAQVISVKLMCCVPIRDGKVQSDNIVLLC